MSQPENPYGSIPPPENQFGAPPAYGTPMQAPRPQDMPAEPARMSWFQRWVGVLLSPGETFADVNRKPTILAPIIILCVIVVASTAVTQWKMGPYMPDMLRAQNKKMMERFGQTPTEEQLNESVKQGLFFSKFSPLIAPVSVHIIYLIMAGLFALGMLLIQAKATFKKIYSVMLWTFAGIGLVLNLVLIASFMVKDEEALRSTNLNNPASTVPTNIGAFLGPDTSPIVKSLADSIDVFSFWTIAVLAIGFAAIANSKNVKTSKTATMIVVLWLIYVGAKTGIAAFMG